MYRVRNSVQSIAPTTTMARGFCACDPIEVAIAAGKSPRAAVKEVMTTGRTRSSGPAHTRLPDRVAPRPHLVAVRDQEHAVLHGHAEDRHEADGPRDAEVRAREIEREHASHRGLEHVDHDEQAVLHRGEHRIEQHHDQAERQGDDPHEAIVGFLHLLEFAGPFDVVALRERDAGLGIVDLSLWPRRWLRPGRGRAR